MVHVINFLQQHCGDWEHTAVVVLYDDSDGSYDHQMGPIINGSETTQDALNGPGLCGDGARLFRASIRQPSMRWAGVAAEYERRFW